MTLSLASRMWHMKGILKAAIEYKKKYTSLMIRYEKHEEHFRCQGQARDSTSVSCDKCKLQMACEELGKLEDEEYRLE